MIRSIGRVGKDGTFFHLAKDGQAIAQAFFYLFGFLFPNQTVFFLFL